MAFCVKTERVPFRVRAQRFCLRTDFLALRLARHMQRPVRPIEPRYPFASPCQYITRLRSGGHIDRKLRIIKKIELHGGSESCLGETHPHPRQQIDAIALETLIWQHIHIDIQITGGPTLGPEPWRGTRNRCPNRYQRERSPRPFAFFPLVAP